MSGSEKTWSINELLKYAKGEWRNKPLCVVDRYGHIALVESVTLREDIRGDAVVVLHEHTLSTDVAETDRGRVKAQAAIAKAQEGT